MCQVKQAVILVGGFGTRLLPLTKTRPKPAMPVLDRPFIMYLIDSLVKAGIDDIILACGYKSKMISASIEECGYEGFRIRYVEEDEPLGTAGAMKNVEDLLDDTFISANGDTLNFVDVSSQIETHFRTNAKVTLSLSEVEDPSSSGVALMDDEGRIIRFQEKPPKGTEISKLVNTGLYVMDKSILKYIPKDTFFDVSKDLFPKLMENDERMCGHMAKGMWIDIGKPADLIRMNREMSRIIKTDSSGAEGCRIEGDFYLGRDSVMKDSVSRNSIISRSCTVTSSELSDSLIMKGCRIDGAKISNSVLGENCTVLTGSIIENGVYGDDSVIGPDA